MKRSIGVLLISVLVLSGCYNVPDKLKPMSSIFNMVPKDAPNNYKIGWKDGCETGLASMTNSFYKKFYTFRQNQKLRTNSLYYKAWQDSFMWCKHYAYGTLRQSDQRYRLPNNIQSYHENFMGGEGILSDKGLLHLYGPGGTTLLPFQKIGDIGGNTDIPSLGGGAAWSQYVGGQSTLDYSDGFFTPGFENGMNMDYSNVPFFSQ